MLPAYVSYFMGVHEGHHSRSSALRSALVIGSIVSAGFLLVFGIAGLVISGVVAGVERTQVVVWMPWLALAVGAGLVVLGIAMLRGHQPVFRFQKTGRAGLGNGYRSVLMFGTSYAVASLSCALPVFLTVVATQFVSRSFLGGLAMFGAYAAGMATVLLGVTVVLALGKQQIMHRVRTSSRLVNQLSGVVLVLAGAWIVWFWGTAMSSGASALGGAAGFEFMERLSQSAMNLVGDNTIAVAVGFGVVILAAATAVARGSSTAGGGGNVPAELERTTYGGPEG